MAFCFWRKFYSLLWWWSLATLYHCLYCTQSYNSAFIAGARQCWFYTLYKVMYPKYSKHRLFTVASWFELWVIIGGFHLYLSELAFINQFYSMMTGIVWLSLANDKFRNHFTISSKYFDMVCYLKWEASSSLISFEVKQTDIWTEIWTDSIIWATIGN